MLALRGGGLFIGLNARHSPQRRHFSFWHEVGHYLLHTDAPRAGGSSVSRTCFESLPIDGVEREADCFAADLMMPREWVGRMLSEGLDLSTMARRFGVTQQALARRLDELGFYRRAA